MVFLPKIERVMLLAAVTCWVQGLMADTPQANSADLPQHMNTSMAAVIGEAAFKLNDANRLNTTMPTVEGKVSSKLSNAEQPKPTHELQLIFFLQPEEGSDDSVDHTTMARILSHMRLRGFNHPNNKVGMTERYKLEKGSQPKSELFPIKPEASQQDHSDIAPSHTSLKTTVDDTTEAKAHEGQTSESHLSDQALPATSESHEAAIKTHHDAYSAQEHDRISLKHGQQADVSTDSSLNTNEAISQVEAASTGSSSHTKATSLDIAEQELSVQTLIPETQRLLDQGYRVCELRIPLVHKQARKQAMVCYATDESSHNQPLSFDVAVDVLLDRYLHLKGDIWMTDQDKKGVSSRSVNQWIKKQFWTYIDHSRFGVLARYQPLV